MTSLAELAGLQRSNPIEAVDSPEVQVDAVETEAAAELLERQDLYRYVGVRPNHVHRAIPD